MRRKDPSVGFPFWKCGRDTKPAEDAPDSNSLLVDAYEVDLLFHPERSAPAASDGEEQPAAAVTDDSDEWHVLNSTGDAPPPAATAPTAPAAEEAQPPAPDDAQTDAVFPTVNGVTLLRILVTNRLSGVEKEVLLPMRTNYLDLWHAVRKAFNVPITVTIQLCYASNEKRVKLWPRRRLTRKWHDTKLLVYFSP